MSTAVTGAANPEMLPRLEQMIGRALSSQTMFLIGMVLTVPMTLMFVGEIFDYQVRFFPPGIVKMQRRWNAKAVTMMAMTAALSVILQAVSAILVLIPGFLTFRADAMVRFPFGAIFGMPAVWGVAIANLLGDALTGSLSPGSAAGALVSWWMAYLFYRLYHGPEDYCMSRKSAWAKYYVVVFLWCILGSFYLCTNFSYLRLFPDSLIWTAIFPAVILTTFVGGLLGPLVARVVGPAAERYGLSRDEMGYEAENQSVPRIA
ncbi:MAG: hypothetical protein WBW53_07060 [Terriglobales bacterium]